MGIEVGESNAAWVLSHCPPPEAHNMRKDREVDSKANPDTEMGKKLTVISTSRCGRHLYQQVNLLRRSGVQGHGDSYRLAGDVVFCLGRYKDSSHFYRKAADSNNGHAALNLG